MKELEVEANDAIEITEEVLVANSEEVVIEENSLIDKLAADSALIDTASLTFEQFAAENPFVCGIGS